MNEIEEKILNLKIPHEVDPSLKNYFQSVIEGYVKESNVIEECIHELPLFPVSTPLLKSLCDQIVTLSEKISTTSKLLDHVLRIVWHSNDAQVIAIYSELKNHLSHIVEAQEKIPARLIERLNSIYGSKDEESSVEGLSALGINYLEDYKQLSSVLESEVPEKNLLAAVHDRLNGAGLATILDLKKHKIYTKDHLFAYLNESR